MSFPEVVGWAVLGFLGCGLAGWLTLVLVALWPARLTVLTANRRQKTNGFVPRCDWRTPSGKTNLLNALVGLSSRGKTRWFVGLVLFGKDDYDPALGVSRIVSRKTTTASAGGDEAKRSETETVSGEGGR